MSERKKILVVEDEPDFARVVGMRLESVGYEVHIAGDAYTGTREILQGDYQLIGIAFPEIDHRAGQRSGFTITVQAKSDVIFSFEFAILTEETFFP